MAQDNQMALDSLISAASAHGDREGNDAHIEALESLLASVCAVLTDEQWSAVLSGDACTELLPQN